MLNQALYARLKQVFKKVEVQHEDIRPKIKLLKTGKYFGDSFREWEFDDSSEVQGESYIINCPICGDTKGHCYISSLSFTRPKIGDRVLSQAPLLINCFRRECFKGHSERRQQLTNLLQFDAPMDIELSGEESVFGSDSNDNLHVNSDETILKWSPDYHPMTKDAPAVVLDYVANRGIDWRDILELKIGWGKCWNHKSNSFLGNDPWLIFPIFDQAGFRGVQSRKLFSDGNMKYFFDTRTPKSMVLYNRQRAGKFRVAAICEGVIDALHIGRCGMAFFGYKPSNAQIRLMQQDGFDLVLYMPDQKKHYTKEGVCDLDPPAIADKYIAEWNNNRCFNWGAYRVDLPGDDAGSISRTQIWSAVIQQVYPKLNDEQQEILLKQIKEV